jgi:hypothetical protein
MRVPFEEKYDAIFNCLPALVISKMKRITHFIAIKESLSEYGFAVIDFLNVSQVLKTCSEEIKTVEELIFERYLKRRTYL